MNTPVAHAALILAIATSHAHASDFLASDNGVVLVQDGVMEYVAPDVRSARGIVVSSTGDTYVHDARRDMLLVVESTGRRVDLLGQADIDGLAIDEANGKLYWASGAANAIRRANIDGTGVETLAANVSATGLALDLANGTIYFVEDTYDEVRRIDLDGGNEEVLDDPLGNIWRRGMALDLTNGRMWWVQTGTVHSADLDGTNTTQFTDPNGGQLGDVAVDPVGGKVYWTDIDNGHRAIRRANLDGTDIEELGTTDGIPYGIHVDGNHVYWTNDSGRVTRAELDGTSPVDILTPMQVGTGLAADPSTDTIWWSSLGGGIWRMALDTRIPENIVADGNNPGGIALDLVAGHLYWTSASGITRANLDGSSVMSVGVGTGIELAVAVDPALDRLFYSARSSIEASNTDGSAPATLASGQGLAFTIAIDPSAGRVYWNDLVGGSISGADYDGANLTTVSSGLVGPTAVAVDSDAGKLYWSDADGVSWSNLDGSDPEFLLDISASAIVPYAAPAFAMTQSEIVGGGVMTFDAVDAPPGAQVFFLASGSVDPANPVCHPVVSEVCSDLQSPTVLGRRIADTAGEASLTVTVPPVPPGFTVYTEAVYLDGTTGGSTGTYTNQAQ